MVIKTEKWDCSSMGKIIQRRAIAGHIQGHCVSVQREKYDFVIIDYIVAITRLIMFQGFFFKLSVLLINSILFLPL